jgi:hypothetical protein
MAEPTNKAVMADMQSRLRVLSWAIERLHTMRAKQDEQLDRLIAGHMKLIRQLDVLAKIALRHEPLCPCGCGKRISETFKGDKP